MFNYLVLLFLTASSLWSQGTLGVVLGKVTDSVEAVIVGSQVVVSNNKTNFKQSTQTNSQGEYQFVNLPPDTYTVTAQAQDFAVKNQVIKIVIGDRVTVNFQLDPQTVSTEIQVQGGDVVTVSTDSAAMNASILDSEISKLPVNGRQISQLYLLAPGATTTGGGSYDNIRFSGRSNQQNIIRHDGIEGTSIIDASPGNLNGQISSFFRLQTSLEAVQEFKVESNNYPAEYGSGTGGQITVVTKSGGNQLHGGVFEYFRNNALDARNFFDVNDTNPLRLNQWGGNLSGAVVKDKTFFFASSESLRQRQSIPFIEAVPSELAKSQAVPEIKPIIALYPTGNTATLDPLVSLAQVDASQKINEYNQTVRVDHRFNSQNTVFVRGFRDQGRSFQPLGVTGNGVAVTAVPQNAVVTYQRVFNSNIINETKVGVNAYKTRAWGLTPNSPLDISAININLTGAIAIPGISSQGASTGFAALGGLIRSNSATNGRAQPYTNTSWNFLDNVSIFKNAHTIKAGGEFRILDLYTDRLGGVTYSFSNVSDFVRNQPLQIQYLGDLSAPSPFNGGASGIRHLNQSYAIGYVQDQWQLKPQLTVNLGVRYEFYSVMRESRNLAVIWSPETGELLSPTTPAYKTNALNFAPRLSVAWSSKDSKTVIRAGSGIYSGPGQAEDLIQPFESSRISTTLTNAKYPVDVKNITANWDVQNPNLRFQPRAFSQAYKIPEIVWSYTLSLQKQLDDQTVITLAYVGSQGRNLFIRTLGNLITEVSTNPRTGSAIIAREWGDRFAEIDVKTSGGRDRYNSLQSTVKKQVAKIFTLGASYTWGRSTGNSGGSNETITVADPRNWNLDRGNNAADIRHNLNLISIWQVTKNWQLSSVLNTRSGLPLDPLIVRPDVVYLDSVTHKYYTTPRVVNGVSQTTAVINVPGGGSSRQIRRPDYVLGVSPYVKMGGTLMLNSRAFSVPLPGTFGNASRYSLRGPGFFQADLSAQRNLQITDGVTLQFRVEVFNILNKTNFSNPIAQLPNALPTNPNSTGLQPGQAFSPVLTGAAFGHATSTVDRTVGLGTSRQIQLHMRLSF